MRYPHPKQQIINHIKNEPYIPLVPENHQESKTDFVDTFFGILNNLDPLTMFSLLIILSVSIIFAVGIPWTVSMQNKVIANLATQEIKNITQANYNSNASAPALPETRMPHNNVQVSDAKRTEIVNGTTVVAPDRTVASIPVYVADANGSSEMSVTPALPTLGWVDYLAGRKANQLTESLLELGSVNQSSRVYCELLAFSIDEPTDPDVPNYRLYSELTEQEKKSGRYVVKAACIVGEQAESSPAFTGEEFMGPSEADVIGAISEALGTVIPFGKSFILD